MTANYYVMRHKVENDRPRYGWIGPIKGGLSQAQLEVAAWVEAGWDASVFAPTSWTKAEVKRWERERAGYAPAFDGSANCPR